MDGISVAASILGLVGAAAKVTMYLNALVTSATTAPKLAKSVLLEVSDVSICLSQLQRLLLGMERGSKSGEHLIMIEQLIVVLSNCVSIISELEEILESMDLMGGTPLPKTKIASWLRRQHSISTLLLRLQASKQSLTLIVTIMNCTSVGEAEDALSELKASITQVLESNQLLAERMANLELQHSAHALSKAPSWTEDGENYRGKSGTTLRQEEQILDDGETSTDSSISALSDKGKDQDNESIITIRRLGPVTSETLTAADGFAFEEDLFASRPYIRAINRRHCQSATSSVVPTMGWSYLSGLSLADVSEVSILSLPLSPLELWNGHRYVTAQDDLEDFAGDRVQQRQALVARTRTMTPTEFPAMSPWLSGKLFDRWGDYFPDMKKTGRRMNLSDNVVLLGVPFSGKRTIYLHLLLFHGFIPSRLDREARCCIIRGLIRAIMVAWKCVQASGICNSSLTEVEEAYWTLVSCDEKEETYDFRLYRALLRLWAHDSLRYEIQNGKALNGQIPELFENLELLFLNTRLLPDDPLLRDARDTAARYYQCQSVDLAGISCELFGPRKKQDLTNHWVSRFDGVDAIYFVVPLSTYCHQHPAFASVNMMKQQIRFFESLTRLEIVRYTPIILLLNKTDVLEQLITKEPISDHFEDYTAGASCFDACQFSAFKFAECDRRAVGNLRIYGTCAVQESGLREILKDLQARPHQYNQTNPSSRLGSKASIHNPEAKPSIDEMLRKYNEGWR